MSLDPIPPEMPVAPRTPPVPSVVWGSALGLSALALSFVSRLPGFPLLAVLAFSFIGIVRLVVGRSGTELVPSWLVRSFQIAGIAIGSAWFFHHLGTGPALLGLLIVCVGVQAFLFVPRQTAFVVFLQVLFSSTTAVGAAFLLKDGPALILGVAYVLALAWTLLLYERGSALAQPESTQGAVRKLRADGGADLPVRFLLRTATQFLLLGFPLGLLLYLGVPRTWDWIDPVDSDAIEQGRDESNRSDGGRSNGTRISAISGPALKETSGAVSVAFGTVAKIKRDFTPWFEVREVANAAPPERVVLRDSTLDLFQTDGTWVSSDLSQRSYRCDASGVVDMGGRDRSGRGRTLEIRALMGGNQRFFLEPNGVNFRVRRAERTLQRYSVTRRGDEAWLLEGRAEFQPGDIVLQHSVPVWHADAELTGKRSDSEVSPRLSYLHVPDSYARRLGAMAHRVVGGERDPWLRARLLENWLRSPLFEYALNPPPVDLRNPIMEFLTRTRSGHCEMFASAVTLMLRTLGHPTRWARGFWGGAASEQRGSVVMRQSDYHAWCEIFLHGVGWVPVNPTPPDRRPSDADTKTVEAEAGLTDDPSSLDFLGLNSETWSQFWRDVGNWINDYVLSPLGSFFGRAPLLFGALLFGLLAWAIRRKMKHVPAEQSAGTRRRAVALGIYGDALHVLAAQGTRRRRTQTLREFESFAVGRHPAIAQDFSTLTRLRELERYAGQRRPDAATRAQAALARIRLAFAST